MSDQMQSTTVVLSPADRQDILDVITEYCFASDERQFARYHDVFTEDAAWDFGEFGVDSGVSKMITMMEEALVEVGSIQHSLGGCRIYVDDTGEVTARTYVTASMTNAGDKELVIQEGGIYLDTLVRTGSGWRISRRSYDVAWHHAV